MDNLPKTSSLNLSLSKRLHFRYKITLGLRLGPSDLNRVNTILWKSDNPLSNVDESLKFLG